MAKKKDTANRCPLCGTKFKLPSYKCKNCNNFYTEVGVIKDKGGKARCPDCKIRVKCLSKDEIIKDLKCKECGVSLKEIKSLREIVTVHSKVRPTKDLQTLETEIDSLSEEIDKILDGTQAEESGVYNCPNCGKEIEVGLKACPYCQQKFSEMDEIPEVLQSEEITEKFECADCGAIIDGETTHCPICGTSFLEEECEMFACPECDADVEASATICPNCGVEFASDEEEEEGEEEKVKVGELEALLDEFVADESIKSLLAEKPEEAEVKTRPTPVPARGLTNGPQEERRGLTNGLTNGLKKSKRGLTNGLTNGLKKSKRGLTNGFTNGLKKSRRGWFNQRA